jgi:hypothetical protein
VYVCVCVCPLNLLPSYLLVADDIVRSDAYTHTYIHTYIHTLPYYLTSYLLVAEDIVRTLTQNTHRTHTEHIQNTYSTHTAHIQHTYSTHTAHIQHTHSTHTAHIQHTYSTHTAHIHTYTHTAHIQSTTHLLVAEDIVRRDARLPRVGALAPHHSLGCLCRYAV